MDDKSSVRSSAVRGNFTSGRRPLGSSSSVLKVPSYCKANHANFCMAVFIEISFPGFDILF